MEPRDIWLGFLQHFPSEELVLGGIMGGSFVVSDVLGTDIDIHVVLKNDSDFHCKGLFLLEGKYRISYVAYSESQWKKIVQREESVNTRVFLHIYATGIIVRDDSGILQEFKNYALEHLNDAFSSPSNFQNELGKYAIWNLFQEVQRAHSNRSIHFSYLYYHLLDQILRVYARFLKTDIPNIKKMDFILLDPDYCERNLYRTFPDACFMDLFSKALKKPNIKKIGSLMDYVLENLGGFDEDRWRVEGS